MSKCSPRERPLCITPPQPGKRSPKRRPLSRLSHRSPPPRRAPPPARPPPRRGAPARLQVAHHRRRQPPGPQLGERQGPGLRQRFQHHRPPERLRAVLATEDTCLPQRLIGGDQQTEGGDDLGPYLGPRQLVAALDEPLEEERAHQRARAAQAERPPQLLLLRSAFP